MREKVYLVFQIVRIGIDVFTDIHYARYYVNGVKLKKKIIIRNI